MPSKYTLDLIIPNCTDRVSIPVEYKEAFKIIVAFCVKSRGGNVRLRISPPVKHRTTGKKSQNHHINGHIQQIANITGQPFDDVKKYCKQQAIVRGYPLLYSEDGLPDLDLWGKVQGESETEIDTTEAGYLIEAIHQFADEWPLRLQEKPDWEN